jgi:hypothetical protein
MVLTPELPGWKPADDEDEDERLGYNINPAQQQVGIWGLGVSPSKGWGQGCQ